ncbi:uncharacterized protein UTRI_03607 [Ustilago trichophora]|uniref:Uncharacterized protein n=1 Tax=Ustilago trichophora TaxID=86804 RepID=A0A5C3E4G9_9BASI|nr:uncharacterized protein UTRI_03607 [Ustilago trichophora]
MVKLKHCFILLASALASANAAAIVKGVEHGQALQRRYANVQGEEGRDGSDLGFNHPGQKSEHTLAKRIHVDTVEELKSLIHDQNLKEMSQNYNTHGHCDGPDSETCNLNICELRTPGCRPFTNGQKVKYARQIDELTFKVLSTGKCNPNAEATKDICNGFGYCDLFNLNGHPQTDCPSLTTQKDYLELLSHLEWQDDSESFVYRKDLLLGSTKEDSSDHSHSGEADGHMTGHLSKRAVSMVESLLARDVVKPQPDGKEAPSAGADDNQSSLVKIGGTHQKRALPGTSDQDGRGHPEAPDQVPSGALDQLMVSMVSSSLASMEMIDQMSTFSANLYFQKKGVCQSGSQNCEDGLCSLGSPGCAPMSRTIKYKMKQMFKQMLNKLFDTGTCTPSPANATCNKAGYCPLSDEDGNEVQGCEEQSMDEITATLKKVQIAFDGISWSFQLPGETQHHFVHFEPITYPLNVYLNEVFGGPMPSQTTVAGKRPKRSIPAAQDAGNGDSSDGTIQTQHTDKFARVALDLANQQMARWTKTFGTCEPNSAACHGGFCKLGSSGCRPGPEEEDLQLLGAYASMFGRVLITGKCTPEPGNEAQCNSLGYCTMSISQNNGKEDPACQALAPWEQQHVLDLLQYNGEGVDIPEATDQTLVSSQTLASIQPSNPKRPGVGSKMKRDLHSVPTDKKGFEGYSAEEIQKIVDESAAAQSMEATEAFAKDYGVCEHKTSACNEKYCTLDTPGCRQCSTEDKEEVTRYYASLYERLLLAGKCQPSTPEGDDQCSKYGHCLVVLNGRYNPRCEKMSKDEHEAFFDEAQKMNDPKDLFPETAGSASSKASIQPSNPKRPGVGSKMKRHVTSRVGERVSADEGDALGPEVVDEPEYKPDEREIHEFMELCKRLSRDAEALEMVAESAGITDPDVIDGLREQFAYLAKHRDWAVEAIKRARESQMLAGSKPQAERFGQKGSEDEPESDDDDKHARGDKVNNGASAGSKWKRDMAGGPGERVPGYETVTFRPEDSQFVDYEPTKHEIRQFMRLCKQLSHDPAALKEIAHAAEIEDESMIEELREQFAYLAKHRGAAIETIKNAKEAQMIAESKLQTQHFGQKEGSDGDEDGKRDAGDKADDTDGHHDSWTRYNDLASPSSKGDHEAESK